MKRLISAVIFCLFLASCGPPPPQNAHGTYTFADGAKYVGELKDDLMHGQGTYTWADGEKYIGEWKDGIKHGQGAFTWPDGAKYVGEWRDGKYHGQGTLTWADGEKYIGEWKDGRRHGQGTNIFANGAKYVGEYKDGKYHVQGTYTWADGRKYVGEYKDDKRHGQGTYTSPNGATYVGEFKDGFRWQGTQYNARGAVIDRQVGGLPAPACNGNQKGGWGTGFAVSPNHVVTNAHMLYCCKKITVLDLSCSDRQEATVVSTEQRGDLGLVRLGRLLKNYATLRNERELALGEAVSTYDRRPEVNDCPQYALGQGKVTKLNWMPDDARVMVHDSPTRKGTSGGPVLDASGHIVGVTRAGRVKTVTNRQSSHAVKSHLLKAFLESNSVEYKTAPSTEELSLSEIKKKSDKFTVQIKCVM